MSQAGARRSASVSSSILERLRETQKAGATSASGSRKSSQPTVEEENPFLAHAEERQGHVNPATGVSAAEAAAGETRFDPVKVSRFL